MGYTRFADLNLCLGGDVADAFAQCVAAAIADIEDPAKTRAARTITLTWKIVPAGEDRTDVGVDFTPKMTPAPRKSRSSFAMISHKRGRPELLEPEAEKPPHGGQLLIMRNEDARSEEGE